MTGRLRRIVAVSAWTSITAACLGGTGGALQPARADDVNPAQEGKPAGQPQPDPQAEERRQEAQHWEQQLTALLYSHLNLIRTLFGDLPRDQRKAIAKAGEQAAKEAAAQLADEQLGRRRRQAARPRPVNAMPRGAGVATSSGDDPAALIAAALQKALADTAGAGKANEFVAELAAREERWRRSMAASLVGNLDTDLWFTAEQREAVERSLLEHWDDRMIQGLHGRQMVNGRQVLPGVRNESILPHLTAKQREVYGPPRSIRVGDVPAWQTLMQRLSQCSPPLDRDPWWFE